MLLAMDLKKVNGRPKAKRKLFTIEQKKEIISAYERGSRITDLAITYDTARSSIATILKKKEEIKAASVAVGVKTLVSQMQRSPINEEMEKLLLVWINERQMAGDIMTKEMICSRAREIYDDLKRNGTVPYSAEAKEEFKGSRGWFEKFKKRSGIYSVSCGEGVCSNTEETDTFSTEFQEWTVINGYKPEQVFHCVEAGLFWKRMPKKTFISKEESLMPGLTPMKDRISLLLCANASGDLKIKPMLVYHSETPSIFKKEKVCKTLLSVYWKSNAKAQVSRNLLVEWITDVLGPTLKQYLRERNMSEKAVLFLDSTQEHPPISSVELPGQLRFIDIKCLPSNVASVLNPMNQQVASNFKTLYTKYMLQRCFDATSFTSLTLREFWRDRYHIVHAIRIIAMAWEKVSARSITAAWGKLWPDFGRIESLRDAEQKLAAENEEIVDKIVFLGTALHLEVTAEDVGDLIREHSNYHLSEEFEELRKLQEQEQEENVEQEDEMPTNDIKKILHHWEEFQSLASKWHANKAEMDRLCALVEDKCLDQFKNILETRDIHRNFDRF